MILGLDLKSQKTGARNHGLKKLLKKEKKSWTGFTDKKNTKAKKPQPPSKFSGNYLTWMQPLQRDISVAGWGPRMTLDSQQKTRKASCPEPRSSGLVALHVARVAWAHHFHIDSLPLHPRQTPTRRKVRILDPFP